VVGSTRTRIRAVGDPELGFPKVDVELCHMRGEQTHDGVHKHIHARTHTHAHTHTHTHVHTSDLAFARGVGDCRGTSHMRSGNSERSRRQIRAIRNVHEKWPITRSEHLRKFQGNKLKERVKIAQIVNHTAYQNHAAQKFMPNSRIFLGI